MMCIRLDQVFSHTLKRLPIYRQTNTTILILEEQREERGRGGGVECGEREARCEREEERGRGSEEGSESGALGLKKIVFTFMCINILSFLLIVLNS